MIIRFGLGLLIVTLLFLFLAYSDFYFTRRVKASIATINDNAEESFNFRPLALPIFTAMSLLFWIPSYYILACNLLLEYRLLLTLLYCAVVTGCVYSYYRRRASAHIAWQSLPFLLGFAIITGIIILSGMAGVHALF